MGLLILCVLIAFFLFFRGGGDTSTTSDQQDGTFNQNPLPTESAGGLLGQLAGTEEAAPAQAPVATARPRATRTPAAQGTQGDAGQAGTPSGVTPGQTWTVMLYQDADDKILEEDIFLDLNEAERVGSTDRINVVAQLDRYKGGFNGDGNWTSSRRYLLTRDDNLNRINSELMSEGEVNMSSGDTPGRFRHLGGAELPGRQVCADPLRPRHGLAGRVVRPGPGAPGAAGGPPGAARGGDRRQPVPE